MEMSSLGRWRNVENKYKVRRVRKEDAALFPLYLAYLTDRDRYLSSLG